MNPVRQAMIDHLAKSPLNGGKGENLDMLETWGEITFERETRDCPANDRLGNGASGGRFIYDVRVLIDGVHRATFHSRVHRRGYYLRDAHGRPIRTKREAGLYIATQGHEVEKQGDFLDAVRSLMNEGLIPSADQQREETLRRQLADDQLRTKCENACGLQAVETFAQELFDMLAFLADGDALESTYRKARDLHRRVHDAQATAINSERESRQHYHMQKQYEPR